MRLRTLARPWPGRLCRERAYSAFFVDHFVTMLWYPHLWHFLVLTRHQRIPEPAVRCYFCRTIKRDKPSSLYYRFRPGYRQYIAKLFHLFEKKYISVAIDLSSSAEWTNTPVPESPFADSLESSLNPAES